MKAREFYVQLAVEVAKDESLMSFYDKYIYDSKYEDTIQIIATGIKVHNLTLEQAIKFSLFIGSSEEL
jgi:hypothetical protein